MIFLIYGATCEALTKVEVKNVIEQGSEFVIKIGDGSGTRSFTVKNGYAEYVRKYKQLRPANVAHDRFFVNFQKGKCTVQPIGRNKFLRAPKAIAKFLKLEDSENYMCSSFRKDNRKIESISCTVDTATVANESTPSTTNTTDEEIKTVAFDSLPKKSQEKYVSTYKKLMAWKTSKEIDKECFSVAVMLDYFNFLKSELPSFLITIF